MDAEIDLFMNNLSVERGLSANTITAYSADLRHFLNYLRESGISLWKEFPGANISGYIQSWGRYFRRVHVLAGWPSYARFSGSWKKSGLVKGNPASLVHFP